jgi:hypothetical protein
MSIAEDGVMLSNVVNIIRKYPQGSTACIMKDVTPD